MASSIYLSRMTGAQMQSIRRRLKLSHAQFARLLATSERSVYRWESGAWRIPLVFGMLAVLWDRHPKIMEVVRAAGEG